MSSDGTSLTQLAARAACVAYWFNPLAWLAMARVRREQEQAADDMAIDCGLDRHAYAGHLLAIVTGREPGGWRTAMATAMARSSKLEHRLRGILDGRRDRRGPARRTVALAVAASAVLLPPLAALAPRGEARIAPASAFTASSGQQPSRTGSPPAGGAADRTAPRTTDPAVAQLRREFQAWMDREPWRMARAQVQAGDPAAAQATLQRAIEHANSWRGLLAVGQVQAEMGDRDAALETLLMARNPDIAPEQPNWQDAATLAEVATAQLRLGDSKAAAETFEQALQFARKLAEGFQRKLAVEAIIKARATAGDDDGALKDVAAIADQGQRLGALSQIPLRGRNVGAEVLERILRMIDAEKTPPGGNQGFDYLKWMLNGMRINVLTELAPAQAAANDRAEAAKTLQRARQIAEAEQEEGTRYSQVGRIARALVKMGDAAEASRMAGAIGKTMWNRKLLVLTDIAEAHAETGDLAATLKAWDDALRAAETGTEKLGVLLKIAEAQAKAGDRRTALGTLDQALIAARSIKPTDPDANRFGPADFAAAQIARARASAGDVAGAIRVARTIRNNQVQGDALAAIATAQAASGDIKGAFETAGTIKPPDPTQGKFITHLADQTSALLGILAAQARAGDVAGALATADRLSLRVERSIAWIVIAEGLDQRNNAGKRAEPARGP